MLVQSPQFSRLLFKEQALQISDFFPCRAYDCHVSVQLAPCCYNPAPLLLSLWIIVCPLTVVSDGVQVLSH